MANYGVVEDLREVHNTLESVESEIKRLFDILIKIDVDELGLEPRDERDIFVKTEKLHSAFHNIVSAKHIFEAVADVLQARE